MKQEQKLLSKQKLIEYLSVFGYKYPVLFFKKTFLKEVYFIPCEKLSSFSYDGWEELEGTFQNINFFSLNLPGFYKLDVYTFYTKSGEFISTPKKVGYAKMFIKKEFLHFILKPFPGYGNYLNFIKLEDDIIDTMGPFKPFFFYKL